MAVITVGAEIPIVNIIPDMTIYTTTDAPVIFLQRLEVAAIAVQPFMCPLDLEIGLIMVELPDQPAVRVVASLTIIAKCAFVNVVILMAIIAV